VLKLSRECNLHCTYCYTKGRDRGRMNASLLFKSISEILQTVSHVDIIYHGGEPLLAGRQLFELAVESEQENLPSGHTVSNFIQTNATLVNDEWINFFIQNDFHIGVSLDGPREVNDANRVYPDGGGTFEDTYTAVKAMNERGLDLAALAVVTPQSILKARQIYNFFLGSPFLELDFLPCTGRQGSEWTYNEQETLSPESFGDFMIKIFDQWKTNRNHKLTIRFFNDVIRTLIGLSPTLCNFSATKTCGRQALTIDCDGEVYICDNFIGIKDMSLGNIANSKLEAILSSDRYKVMMSKVSSLPSECAHCCWLENCDGDCTYHRFLRSSTLEDVSYYCQAKKRIFERIYSWLST